MRVSKTIELYLGDLRDADVIVTADVTRSHCQLVRVMLFQDGEYRNVVDELRDSARDRIIEEMGYAHDTEGSNEGI